MDRYDYCFIFILVVICIVFWICLGFGWGKHSVRTEAVSTGNATWEVNDDGSTVFHWNSQPGESE